MVGDFVRGGFVCGGDGHDGRPPIHDAVGLGKEAVSADIDAIVLVTDGAGNTAHVFTLLQDDGLDFCAMNEFKRRRQPGGACAND